MVCVMVASSKLFKTYKSCARDGGAGNFPAQPVGPESKAVWVWVVCRVVVEMQKTLGHKFIESSAFLYIFIEVDLRVVKRI